MCDEKVLLMLIGASGGSSMHRPGSGNFINIIRVQPWQEQGYRKYYCHSQTHPWQDIISIIVELKFNHGRNKDRINIIVTVIPNLGRNKDIVNIIVEVKLNLGRNMYIINIIVTVKLNLVSNKDIMNIIVSVKPNLGRNKDIKILLSKSNSTLAGTWIT